MTNYWCLCVILGYSHNQRLLSHPYGLTVPDEPCSLSQMEEWCAMPNLVLTQDMFRAIYMHCLFSSKIILFFFLWQKGILVIDIVNPTLWGLQEGCLWFKSGQWMSADSQEKSLFALFANGSWLAIYLLNCGSRPPIREVAHNGAILRFSHNNEEHVPGDNYPQLMMLWMVLVMVR